MIGGKALYLDSLRRAGFNIPTFCVFEPSLDEKSVLEKITNVFPNTQYFAIRSSTICEDSEKKSYAGYFYSAIGVKRQEIFKEFLKIRESYNGRSGNIIIQEFIASEKSGVLFTNGGDGKIIINSNLGLCDLVVKGYSCDEYIIDKLGKVISKNIPLDKQALFFKNGEMKITAIGAEESLTKEEIKELLRVANKIEKRLGGPQDIEWGFLDGKLYIFQSRPITKSIFNSEKIHYDSANIAESYSGIVLPLTFSFASFVYQMVYKDLLAASGVSRKKLEAHDDIFNNLLKQFYGRMYYNMNNWYKMTAFLPGYNRNKQNFENMITSNIREEVFHNIAPSLWLKIKYPFLFLFKLISFQFKVKRFKKKVEQNLKQAREIDWQSLDYEECRALFNKLNNKLLRNWYISVENDFLVMTYLGLLKKIFPDKELNRLLHFESVSTQQIKDLQVLVDILKQNPVLWQTIENNNQAEFSKNIKQFIKIQEKLSQYYLKYGGRFANELKLESSDIEDDFNKFVEVVKAYASLPVYDRPKEVTSEKKIKHRIGPRLILNRFKKYACQREELRLLRSNSFAIVRKLCNRIGEILEENEIIKDKKDIFYLTIDEIFNHSKVFDIPNFQDQVNKRKKEYTVYKDIVLPSYLSLSLNEMPSITSSLKMEGVKKLQGRPCASGSVIGKVKIFKDFNIPKDINFDIIVTRHTDPGWTTLIGLSKGLIVEHGGILSHASIVSRELGIPTVIGVLGATENLIDGQIVELNGSTGIVTLID